MKPLVQIIKGCLDQLGQEKAKKILREFCHYPFVDGDLDYPRLYNMCMSQPELQNPVVVQETPRIIHEDDNTTVETAAFVEETTKILEKLDQNKATTILNECNQPGHGIDLQLLHKKAVEELGAIKGKKPISVPPRTHTHHEKVEKQKLLHDAIKIGEKRARRSDEDDDYDHHQEEAIPGALKRIMAKEKGNNPVLVIQKNLSKTDVNPHNARLSLPVSQVDASFLSRSQKEILFQEPREGEKMPRLEAKLLEPNGSVSKIYLTRWNMRGGAIFNLVTTWKDVVKDNSLREGMEVQVWSFRGTDSQFWLALFTL